MDLHKIKPPSLSLWTTVSVLSEAVSKEVNLLRFILSFHHLNPTGIMWIKGVVMVFKVSTATFCLRTYFILLGVYHSFGKKKLLACSGKT
jgi:hypothetical protein